MSILSETSVEKNLPRITGTIREDLRTFMVISHCILLRMRNVSNRSCGDNQNTCFVFCDQELPPPPPPDLEIVPFMR
jgi:hypothetical protein